MELGELREENRTEQIIQVDFGDRCEQIADYYRSVGVTGEKWVRAFRLATGGSGVRLRA